MKNLISMFFVKAYEWNFSYEIEKVQSTHIPYMNKYFIMCYYYLNHFLKIFGLCNILVHVLIFHKCTI
jgi:hypothetical protein